MDRESERIAIKKFMEGTMSAAVMSYSVRPDDTLRIRIVVVRPWVSSSFTVVVSSCVWYSWASSTGGAISSGCPRREEGAGPTGRKGKRRDDIRLGRTWGILRWLVGTEPLSNSLETTDDADP
jgi:hypothetical protein